jgi:hypothetical protein
MFKVILRSVCVGFGALASATLFALFVVMPVTFYLISKPVAPAGAGEGEVGWDLISIAHNQPGTVKLIALAALLIFAGGYYFGFRHFSESPDRR